MGSTYTLNNKRKTMEIQEQAEGKERWIFIREYPSLGWKWNLSLS